MNSSLSHLLEDTSILSKFSRVELDDLISVNPALRGYIQGYLGELSLMKQLYSVEGVSDICKIPDRDPMKGDISFKYGNTPITIEVKSLLSDSIRKDILNDTWSGRVLTKNTDKRVVNISKVGPVLTSAIFKGTFDILAISCYAVSHSWDFLYMANENMPEQSENTPGLVKTSFYVNPVTTPFITQDLLSLLDSVVLSKSVKIR